MIREDVDPYSLVAEADDLFIFAPSVLYVESMPTGLLEGKAVGTAKEIDLLFLDLDQTISARTNPAAFSDERKKGVTVGKRVLVREQKRIGPLLLKALTDHESGKFGGFAAFKKHVVSIMKPAWKRVFEAGVRATGIKGVGAGKAGAPLVKLDADDEKWLRSAMQHEMKFLNGMLQAVEEQTYKMPLPQRVRMYVRTMESFYDSARAIGLPATVLIHWKGKNDEKTCVGCNYMFQHSPYTKKTLPTVPRAGLTPCLSNCRDRLLIRQTTPEAVIAATNASKYTRGSHIKNLRKLKSKGHL